MISATMLIAACGAGDEGSTTVPTDQVSSTEPGSTTIATSSTAPVAAPVANRLIAMQGDKLALLDRASGELEVLVDEVVDQIYVTAISPNGRYILYVTDDDDDASGAASVMGGFSRVWDVEAGEPTVDMQPAIAGAVFLPNSTDLIVAGTHLYWMDLSTGEAVDHGFEERSTPQVIELMPDGATLVTSSGGRLVFDSIETGDEIKVWNFEKEVDGTIFGATVTGVSVSRDGTLVAVGIMSRVLPELNAIHVIDYATDEPLHVIPYQLTGQNPALRQVALSPDGGVLVAAFQEDLLRGGHLEIFDVASGEAVITIPVVGAVQRVAFSPDGTLLAVGTTKSSGLKLYGVAD
jgi:WD40 repeat protein